MKDGIYRVRFDSNQDDFGFGIVTVRANRINGGDHTCYYQGVIKGDRAELHVVTHNKNNTSVFGTTEQFDLELTFSEMPVGIIFNGHIKGHPEMTLTGSMNYLGDLI